MTTYIKNEPELETEWLVEEGEIVELQDTTTKEPKEFSSSNDEPPVAEEENEHAVDTPTQEDQHLLDADTIAPTTEESPQESMDAVVEAVEAAEASVGQDAVAAAVVAAVEAGQDVSLEDHLEQQVEFLPEEERTEEEAVAAAAARPVDTIETNVDWEGDFPYEAYEPSKLHEYLCDCNWQKALEYLEGDEKYVMPKANDSNNYPQVSEIGFVDDAGALPLHRVLNTTNAPVELLVKLLQRGNSNGDNNNNYANVRHRVSNDLPLHMACRVASMENLKILLLLDAYPVAVWAESGDGASTALHILAESNPDLNTIRTIVNVAEKNKLQVTASVFLVKDSQGSIPLHLAIEYQAPTDVIMYLMKASPESIYVQRQDDGCLPLHSAAHVGCSGEVLEYLLQEHAAGVEQQSSEKYTPLHLIFHPDDEISIGRWQRDAAASLALDPSDMVMTMLKAYYKHFVETYRQAQARNKRKRKRNGGPKSLALKKVQQVINKLKNKLGWTVIAWATKCVENYEHPPRDLERIVEYMRRIVAGRNVFENA